MGSSDVYSHLLKADGKQIDYDLPKSSQLEAPTRFLVRCSLPTLYYWLIMSSLSLKMDYSQYILETKGRVKAGVGNLGDHLNLILFAILRASKNSLLIVVFKKII